MQGNGGKGVRTARGRSTTLLRALRVTIAVLVLAATAGCATRREALPVFPESLLLTDYTTWFAADVEGNRELLSYVLDELDSELVGVVDRTARISGGVRLLPRSPAEVSAVATGRFPRGGAQFALNWDRSFERFSAQVEGRNRVYYRQREGTLQLALPAPDVLYVSTGRVLEMLQDRPPAELELDPDVYRSLRLVGTVDGPDALVVIDRPGAGLLESLGVTAQGLPIDRIDLSITNRGEDQDLELGGALFLRSERDASLFGRLGRLFVLVFVRSLGIDGARVQQEARIDVEGARVVFSGVPVQRDELVGVIRRLGGAEETQ